MLRSYVVIALRNLMRDKLHGSSRYNQIKNSEFVLRKLYLPLLNAPSSVVNLGKAQIPVWSGGRWIPAIYPLGTDSPSEPLAQLRGDK